jgi:hypothetical protein
VPGTVLGLYQSHGPHILSTYYVPGTASGTLLESQPTRIDHLLCAGNVLGLYWSHSPHTLSADYVPGTVLGFVSHSPHILSAYCVPGVVLRTLHKIVVVFTD